MTMEKHAAVAWPLMLRQLAAAQGALLSGVGRSKNQILDGSEAGPQAEHSLAARFEKCTDTGSVTAGGGCTDASVRLTHILKGMAKTPPHILESHTQSRDWVPLLLAYISDKSPGVGGAPGIPAAAAGDGDDEDDDISPGDGAGDGAAAIISPGDGAEARGVGKKVWRAQLREWLQFFGGLKNSRGIFRSAEVQQSVALMLLDSDPVVQQAALKCLQVCPLASC